MNKYIQLLLTAALPAVLSAGTISIGNSTDPITFTPTGISAGTISVGTCTSDCLVSGVSNHPPLDITWSVTSTGTLTYSGGPTTFGLAGNNSAFSLSDTQSDSLSGSIVWNGVTEGATTTDINGTVTLSDVHFASASDPLALAAIAQFGSLPTSGYSGSIDLVVSCGSACITTVDPVGQILATTVALSPGSTGSPVPEPGTLVLPGLALAFMAFKRR